MKFYCCDQKRQIAHCLKTKRKAEDALNLSFLLLSIRSNPPGPASFLKMHSYTPCAPPKSSHDLLFFFFFFLA